MNLLVEDSIIQTQFLIVDQSNIAKCEYYMDQFFRLRKQIYIDEKGWQLTNYDGREIDQFDNADATYLLGLRGEQVVSGSRFTWANRPNLTFDVFGHFFDTAEKSRPSNWIDWTRAFVRPDLRDRKSHREFDALCTAVMQYCFQIDAARMGGIQELYFLGVWKRLGWSVFEENFVESIDGVDCKIAYIQVDETSLDNAALRLGGALPTLHRNPTLPCSTTPLISQTG